MAGDAPDQAIRKEISEELFSSRNLPNFEIKKVLSFLQQDFPNNNEIMHLYEAIYPGPFYHDEKEVAEEPVWMSWDKLVEDMDKNHERYTPSFHCIIKEYTNLKL